MSNDALEISGKPSGSGANSTANRPGQTSNPATSAIKKEAMAPPAPVQAQGKPISAVPQHMRDTMGNQANGTNNAVSTKELAQGSSTGLQTPGISPAGVRAQQGQRQNQPYYRPQPHPQPRVQPQAQDRRVNFTSPLASARADMGSSSSSTASASVIEFDSSKAAANSNGAVAVKIGAIDEDSFEFSDDEAFLAAVMDLDEGLGGPIHFEDDNGMVEDSFAAPVEDQRIQQRQQQRFQPQAQAQMRAAQPSRPAAQNDSRNLNPNPMQRAAPPEVQQQRNALTSAAHSAPNQIQNQSIPPQGSTPSSSSRGGFRFPPGMGVVRTLTRFPFSH